MALGCRDASQSKRFTPVKFIKPTSTCMQQGRLCWQPTQATRICIAHSETHFCAMVKQAMTFLSVAGVEIRWPGKNAACRERAEGAVNTHDPCACFARGKLWIDPQATADIHNRHGSARGFAQHHLCSE